MKIKVLKFEFPTEEMCSHCNSIMFLDYSVQRCPVCGEIISACTMCNFLCNPKDKKGCFSCEQGNKFVINQFAEEDIEETEIEV